MLNGEYNGELLWGLTRCNACWFSLRQSAFAGIHLPSAQGHTSNVKCHGHKALVLVLSVPGTLSLLAESGLFLCCGIVSDLVVHPHHVLDGLLKLRGVSGQLEVYLSRSEP